MSASDPNQGFPAGGEDGVGRPAEPADTSADPVGSGAGPASSAEPADSAQQPEAAAGSGADPEPGTGPSGAASGGEPEGRGSETTGPWRSAVANRPPRAGVPDEAGEGPDGAAPAGAASAGAEAAREEPSAADDQAGRRPEPPQPQPYRDPSAAAPEEQPQWAYPQDASQTTPHAQHPPAAPSAGPSEAGASAGPAGPAPGPYAPPPAHPGGTESASWSGAGAGAPGHPGGGPYGPGTDPGAPYSGGWPAPGAHPGGPGYPGHPGHPGGPAGPGGPGGGYPPPPYGEGHPGGPHGDEQRTPSFFRRNTVVLVAAATALITSLVVGPAAAALTAWLFGGGGTSALDGDSGGSVSSGDVSAVADQALPSVVSIGAGQGAGSGVIISSDGRILTNSHVVTAAEGDTVDVAFNDGSEAPAQILGSDPVSDLAVIEAQNKSGLTTAELGDSDKVEVGADVVAIGSPLGLQGTVTNGVVSAMNRPVNTGTSGQQQEPENPFGLPEDPEQEEQQEQDQEQLQTSTVINAIQTDAPINPGNSGGPLMNMNGEVIGINTAIASTSSMGQAGSIGLGFSIPINQAKPIAQQLIEDGSADYAAVEATITQGNGAGSRIVDTSDGGAADQAGLERGDRVTHVDGEKVDDPNALIAAIRAHQPGDTITIGYVRDDEEHETEVTLSAQSSDSLNG
ncbi:trypsin-like peptidase domain-containing protein [Streptomonospora salina]|uniref:Putative serine protease PepD n=1 Tax=Streptomonospora salina TaxID=104205 RepID=A0A841EED9_9ACTN|nr:trypsin-like peptidase domain-containing protein [Streptomonospora salina]MBB5999278.1 putative serine protease PepD [Streptomonospora salina]